MTFCGPWLETLMSNFLCPFTDYLRISNYLKMDLLSWCRSLRQRQDCKELARIISHLCWFYESGMDDRTCFGRKATGTEKVDTVKKRELSI